MPADPQPGLLVSLLCDTASFVVDELTIWIYFRTAPKRANVVILSLSVKQ